MLKNFFYVMERIVNDHGKAVFGDEHFKALLADYSEREYPDESALLLLALDSGLHETITHMPDEKAAALKSCAPLGFLPEAIFSLTKDLCEGYFLEEDAALFITMALWNVLRSPLMPTGNEFSDPHLFGLFGDAAIFSEWRKKPPPRNSGGENNAHAPGVSGEKNYWVPADTIAIAKAMVTQLEYWEMTGDSPSYLRGENLPVDGVNWYEAVEFCNRASERDGFHAVYAVDKTQAGSTDKDPRDPWSWTVGWNRTVRGYRLPTIAERESCGELAMPQNIQEWCWDAAPAYLSRFTYGCSVASRNGTMVFERSWNAAFGEGYCLNVNRKDGAAALPRHSYMGPTGFGSFCRRTPVDTDNYFKVLFRLTSSPWFQHIERLMAAKQRNDPGIHSAIEDILHRHFFIEERAAAFFARAISGAYGGKNGVNEKRYVSLLKGMEKHPPGMPLPHNKMILLVGGDFTMGCLSGKRKYAPRPKQARVESFSISRHTVTQKDFESLMGYNPSYIKERFFPVESVSWMEAVEYCNALSLSEHFMPAYTINAGDVDWDRQADGYRLPTSAEWEYACRAGTKTDYYCGDAIDPTLACYNANSIMPVGSFPPNQWGIYDMHGNVWEWCWNRIDEDLPPQAPRFLERARVVRGGSYEYGCATINSWYRLGHKETRDGYMGPYGIRLVRNGGEP